MAMYKRIANAWITLFFVRMKYFFAWKVGVDSKFVYTKSVDWHPEWIG